MFRHRWNWCARELHRSISGFLDDEVERRVCGILVRIVITEMAAATFLALDRRSRDRLGDREQILEIERGVPARIVFAIAANSDAFRALAQSRDLVDGHLHLPFFAHD